MTDLESVAQSVLAWRAAGERIVLAHGTFDLLHYGHLEHLREARSLGDRLVVTVTVDKHVRKGPGRPIHTQAERAEMLAHLDVVDAVAIVDDSSALPAIEAIRPDIYVKGPDYAAGQDNAGWFEQEKEAVERNGGHVAYTSGKTMSATAIINQTTPRVSPEASKFLATVRRDHGLDGVLGWLEKARTLSGCVVGEKIVDEYIYVSPRWKSSKEDVIAYVEESREGWGGGAWIIEQHLRAFVEQSYIIGPGEPIKKTRYVTSPFYRKLFNIVANERVAPLDMNDRNKAIMEQRDFVIVADFGEGAFGTKEALFVVGSAQFLALTVQSNSLNWGFNLLTKWPAADYVVSDEMEWRLAAQDRYGPIESIAAQQAERLAAKTAVVTMGHLGCLVLAKGHEPVVVPAFADKIVDRMGAGDAFLAATAPLACLGAPPEIIGLVGNVAGGIEVGVVGNSKALDSREVEQWLTGLLK